MLVEKPRAKRLPDEASINMPGSGAEDSPSTSVPEMMAVELETERLVVMVEPLFKVSTGKVAEFST